jgi:hypothetical protein
MGVIEGTAVVNHVSKPILFLISLKLEAKDYPYQGIREGGSRIQ